MGTLFRETTYATTLLKYLTQTVCQRYLSAVLGDAIHDACSIDYALEVQASCRSVRSPVASVCRRS